MVVQFIPMALRFLSKGSMKKGEKAGVANSLMANMSAAAICRLILRFLQFIMGIVVIGLYAQDLTRAHKAGKGYDTKWMYATIVGTLSSFYALLCMLPFWKTFFLFFLEFCIFIFYTAAFGVFGKMYLKEDPEGDAGITRMKNAVWVLLVNMLLWFATFVYCTLVFYKHWKGSTPWTGRAPAHPQMSSV